MTDDMIAFSRRAIACKDWLWMPGMLLTSGLRLFPGAYAFPPNALPDLTDPATVGCLLALVRKAWGDPTLCVVLDTSDGRWCVGCWEDNGIAMRGRGGATETEALVNALEGAP